MFIRLCNSTPIDKSIQYNSIEVVHMVHEQVGKHGKRNRGRYQVAQS